MTLWSAGLKKSSSKATIHPPAQDFSCPFISGMHFIISPRVFLPHLLFLAALLFAGNANAVTELPKLLQQGIPLGGISSGHHEGVVFRIVVPANARNLLFRTSGGTGDCDLFVRRGAHPTSNQYDAMSDLFGSRESVLIGKPEPGNWYVLVTGTSAFQRVTLIARYTRGASGKPVPRFFPAPGAYSEQVKVKLQCNFPGRTLRYTTDGSDPDETSPLYRAPLTFTTDTSLRVRAYFPGKIAGPIVRADYLVAPAGTVRTMVSGLPITHLAGTRGSSALFKITVPPGRLRLDILSEGGSGESDFYLRRGAVPTTSVFDGKGRGVRHRAHVRIMHPEAGDWFILLRARSNFARCSLMASHTGIQPDLTIWPGILEPYRSVETFQAGDCEVEEGLISAGTHTLLRFSTESRNIGGSDLVMPPIHQPDGSVNPIYEYQACHDHHHFLGFARYRLLNARNEPVASGRKVSFCLEDVRPWSPFAAPTARYSCHFQGIQTGWSDIYDAGLPGQWIDITGVPPGDYMLEVTVNPDGLIEEEEPLNNTVRVPVEIGGP